MPLGAVGLVFVWNKLIKSIHIGLEIRTRHVALMYSSSSYLQGCPPILDTWELYGLTHIRTQIKRINNSVTFTVFISPILQSCALSPIYHKARLFCSDKRLQTHWVITNTKPWPPACYKCSLVMVRPSCRGWWWNVLSDWAIFIQSLTQVSSEEFLATRFSMLVALVILLMNPTVNNTIEIQTVIKTVTYNEEKRPRITLWLL